MWTSSLIGQCSRVLCSVRQQYRSRKERGVNVALVTGNSKLFWGKMTMMCFLFFYHFPLVSWSQTCKLFFHTIKVKWWRWAKSEGFGLSWLSEWGRRRDGGREYKLDAYVSDMMANKKRLLVLVSTGPHCLNLMKIGWAQRNSDKLNGPSKALLVL